MTQALTITETEPVNDALAEFEFTPKSIAAIGEKYLTLKSVDTKTRAECGSARSMLVSTRTGIDKRRLELNADDQSRIKRRNSAAKLLTDALAPYENHLDATIGEYDSAKKAEKEAKAAAAQKEIDDRIAALAAEREELARVAREAEEARLATERESLRVERERMAAEEAERKRVAAEAQALIDAENARKQAEFEAARVALVAEQRRAEEAARAAREAETDRINQLNREAKAQQDAIEEANRKAQAEIARKRQELEAEAARVEATRIAQERTEAERVAAAQAEAERLAREEAERVANEKRKAELEAARPDAEKLSDYIGGLQNLNTPTMATEDGRLCLAWVERLLDDANRYVRKFSDTVNGQEMSDV